MAWRWRRQGGHNPVNWKANLAALWLSQFLTIGAFSFCIPFLPLYLKESGIVPGDEAQHWAGILLAAPAFSMVVMAPIWGALGDRYGRKMMLARATLAGAFVLYLMGVVGNIEALVVLRLLQGAFTGSSSAAQTLVSTHTPDRNQGFATGLLMAAISAGTLAGATLGGYSAKYFGAAMSFKIAGITVFVSTLIVLAAVREHFTRPESVPTLTRSARIRRRRESVINFRAGLPVLAVIGVVSFIQTFDGPFISLYIDHLYRDIAVPVASRMMPEAEIAGEVYGITGLVSGVAGLAAVAGSIVTGILLDRTLPMGIWPLSAIAAGGGAFLVAWSPSIAGLAGWRAVYVFFISGLASALVVVLGRLTPRSKRGAALGWSMTVRCIGWGLAPMSGALAASRHGWAAAFAAMGAMCLLAAPMFVYLAHRYRSAFHPMEEDESSLESVGVSSAATPGGQGRVG